MFFKKLIKTPIKYLLDRKILRFDGYVNKGDFNYVGRGLMTKRNCDFMKEAKFLDAAENGFSQHVSFYGKKMKDKPYWERHVSLWAATQASRLQGDFVECGVATGMTSMTIVKYLEFDKLNRKFYLFDTFSGLDRRYSSDKEYIRYQNKYPDSYEFVKKSFENYHNVILVRGSVPETLTTHDIRRVAYLHIDMNCALPEIAALGYFWPKLEAGAVVILDDYGWDKHKDQKEAMDKFAKSENTAILTMPTGQGMMLK